MRTPRNFALGHDDAFVKSDDQILTMRCKVEIEGATMQVGDFVTLDGARYRVNDLKFHHYIAALKVTKMSLRLVQEESAP